MSRSVSSGFIACFAVALSTAQSATVYLHPDDDLIPASAGQTLVVEVMATGVSSSQPVEMVELVTIGSGKKAHYAAFRSPERMAELLGKWPDAAVYARCGAEGEAHRAPDDAVVCSKCYPCQRNWRAGRVRTWLKAKDRPGGLSDVELEKRNARREVKGGPQEKLIDRGQT